METRIIQEDGIQKVVNPNNGEVAVLISGERGSGWYTANEESKNSLQALYDPEIVLPLLEGKDLDDEYFEQKYDDFYFGSNFDSLEVFWVKQGELFYIENYDGGETLITQDKFLKA